MDHISRTYLHYNTKKICYVIADKSSYYINKIIQFKFHHHKLSRF